MQAAAWLVSPLLAATGLIGKKKKEEAARPLPIASRDTAREEADRRDELRRRRGGAADIVTGAMGAEAGAGGKQSLGS